MKVEDSSVENTYSTAQTRGLFFVALGFTTLITSLTFADSPIEKETKALLGKVQEQDIRLESDLKAIQAKVTELDNRLHSIPTRSEDIQDREEQSNAILAAVDKKLEEFREDDKADWGEEEE